MIHLRTLGTIELQDGDGQSIRSVLAQPKRLALLTYLAVAESRGLHRRDELLALFWPELDAARGRAALSQALYYLRRSLGPDALIGRGSEDVGVSSEHVWCDAAALDRLLLEDDESSLTAAVESYRGDFLPGFHLSDTPPFEKWLDGARTRLRGQVARAAWTLSERAEAAGNFARAVECGREALRLADYDEPRFRRLLQLLDGMGDRAGAIRAYEEMVEHLAREYDLEPAPETQYLVAEIRARMRPTERSSMPGPHGEAPAPERDTGPPPPTSAERRPPHPPDGSDDPPDSSDDPRHPVGRTAGARWVRVGSGLAVLAVAAVVLWPGAPTAGPTPATTQQDDPTRVAVLPLSNLSPDARDGYIAEGLTAELITRFSRLRDLRVTPYTSVRGFGASELTVTEIAAELGVGTVIEGEARKMGDAVRIAVRLIDASSEEVLWSATFDGSTDDLLDVQRRVAEEVARALKVENRARGEGREALRITHPEAYDEYLRGRALLTRLDRPSLLAALDYFGEALRIDPDFAEAWSGLANAYNQLAMNGALAGPDAWERARGAAERALELDEELAEAHAALATVHSVFDWNAPEAERRFQRAIDLDPSYAEAHREYAVHLRNMGRFDEALERVRSARRLDARSAPPVLEEAMILYVSRRLDEAIDLVERLPTETPRPGGPGASDPSAPSTSPEPFRPRLVLALLLAEKGELGRALDILEAADPTGNRPDTRALRAYIYARSGREADARAILREMHESADGAPVSAFHEAVIHVGLGEHETALDLLEEAMVERTPLVRLLGVEPKLDPLRPHPRFGAMLRRMGLSDASEPPGPDPSPGG